MREREIPRVAEPVGRAAQSVVPENPTDRVTSISISQAQRTREFTAPPAVTGGQPSEAATVQPRPADREQPEPPSTAPASLTGVSAIEPSFKRVVRAGGGHSTAHTSSIGPDGRRAPRSTSPALQRAESHELRRAESRVLATERRDAALPALSSAEARLTPRPELASDTSPLPVDEVNRLFQAVQEIPPARPVSRQVVEPRPEAPPRFEPARHAEPEAGSERIHVDIVGVPGIGARDTFTPPAVEDKPLGAWPIDERPWTRGIPRCCDTCREFQRNPDGKTGVCGSKYAFARRTVVECDQLACRSSVGVWWLPSDDFWLDRAEIAHHTRPTPYLDAILSELQSETR